MARTESRILGIWDGHDSGACIVDKGRICVAVNEERFTRRKLEIGFPKNSILYCLKAMASRPDDIQDIAYSTRDFSLTLTRLVPKIKENYYYVRRRIRKARFENINRRILNHTGKFRANIMFRKISHYKIKDALRKMGFKNFRLYDIDHHKAHAACAYFPSGIKKAVVFTIDGIGDGYSSTVSIGEKDEITELIRTKSKDSLGLFFQEVTSLLGMRILEDEGKVMSLADYSPHIPIQLNPMARFFRLEEGRIKSTMPLERRFRTLQALLYSCNKETFCRMAQDALEHHCINLAKYWIKETGIHNAVFSGGIASNIKHNMKVVSKSDIRKWFIFPHMGDGGLAVGAALFVSNKIYGGRSKMIKSLSLGPEYSNELILTELRNNKKINFVYDDNASRYAADAILDGDIVYWFSGRMEYGPRALGNRSIIALPDNLTTKNRLNNIIKRRDWFQPFCPAILEDDANKMLEAYTQDSGFMTLGYMTKDSARDYLKGVTSVDGSCRPQIVNNNNSPYKGILKRVRKVTGYGAILNTSFNIHGEPIVMSPKDAIDTLIRTGKGKLVMGNYIVESRQK